MISAHVEPKLWSTMVPASAAKKTPANILVRFSEPSQSEATNQPTRQAITPRDQMRGSNQAVRPSGKMNQAAEKNTVTASGTYHFFCIAKPAHSAFSVGMRKESGPKKTVCGAMSWPMNAPIAAQIAPGTGPKKMPASGTSAALTLNVAPVPIMGKAGTSVTTAISAAQTAITAGWVERSGLDFFMVSPFSNRNCTILPTKGQRAAVLARCGEPVLRWAGPTARP